MAWLYRVSPSFQGTAPRLVRQAVSQQRLMQLQDFNAFKSHGLSASVSQPAADFCPVFMLSALCCDFNYVKCNYFFYSAKHMVRKSLSIHFQHILQFHDITHLFTQQLPENPVVPWAPALWGTCMGISPLEKSNSTPQLQLCIKSHTSPGPNSAGLPCPWWQIC